MSAMVIEDVEFAEIVGDMEIPCTFMYPLGECPHHATWSLVYHCTGCGESTDYVCDHHRTELHRMIDRAAAAGDHLKHMHCPVGSVLTLISENRL